MKDYVVTSIRATNLLRERTLKKLTIGIDLKTKEFVAANNVITASTQENPSLLVWTSFDEIVRSADFHGIESAVKDPKPEFEVDSDRKLVMFYGRKHRGRVRKVSFKILGALGVLLKGWKLPSDFSSNMSLSYKPSSHSEEVFTRYAIKQLADALKEEGIKCETSVTYEKGGNKRNGRREPRRIDSIFIDFRLPTDEDFSIAAGAHKVPMLTRTDFYMSSKIPTETFHMRIIPSHEFISVMSVFSSSSQWRLWEAAAKKGAEKQFQDDMLGTGKPEPGESVSHEIVLPPDDDEAL